ncbi:MAG: hypothetical protein JWM31_1713, partial [Solirubrobacterales bacterium]|nr:hypothetical protein [Solirubrobacterales bacterium]
MSAKPSTVTVTGPDRGALMANLTVRFGRVEVVSERQIALPGGGSGWELTVEHRPFVSNVAASPVGGVRARLRGTSSGGTAPA